MNRSLFFWFLRFRLKQLLRIGLDIGAASALIIIAIIVIAFSALYIKSYESGYLPLAVFALVCAWLHSSRGDKNFVGMYIRKS